MEMRDLVVPTDFMGARPREGSPEPSMGLQRRMASLVHVPERSAVSTMAASRGQTRSVAGRASEGASVAGVDSTRAVVEGSSRLGRS